MAYNLAIESIFKMLRTVGDFSNMIATGHV